MRITRSTLRRLIAEESTRLLREAAFPEEIEAVYGRGRKGEEEDEEERGTRMLHVIYHGGSYEGGGGFPETMFIVTDFQANPLDEEAEDVTDEITGGSEDLSDLEIAQATKDWLLSHYDVGFVVDEGIHDTETDENDSVKQYIAHLDSVIESAEKEAFGDKGGEMHKRAVERGEDEGLFEGEDLDALDEMDDQEYNEYLQQQHGRFTTPENVKGTPEYAAKHRQPSAPRHSQEPSRGSVFGGGYDYSEYDHLVREGGPGDDFLDYDPEEIPDMDDQYDPDYYEGLDDEGDDEDFMDYETGEDDVPYGAADVALRQGRGHRTDESKGHREDKTDPYERGEGTYGKRARREEIGLTRSSMIWDPSGKIGLVKNDAQADDINSAAQDLNDPERTHPLRQTILGKPGFRPVAELTLDLSYGGTAMDTQVQATIETDDGQTFVGVGEDAVDAIKDAEAQWRDAESDAAAYGRDVEETDAAFARDRDRPGNFLKEGHDPLDSSDYEGSRHRRAYSDDPDDESGKVDRWGEPIPYLKHDSEATDLDAAAEDEMAGEEEDWSWDGYDYEPDLKRTSHYAHTAQKYKETGNSDPGMDPDDHSFGRARGLDESDDSQGDDDFSAGGDDDYEHAYSMGGGSDEEGFAIDYDTGRPSPFAAKHLPKPRPAQDDVEGPDQDDVWGNDDMGRRGARDDYHHAYKLGGGRDEEGFAADYDTGKKRQFPPARGGISEARWAKLAGILKG